MTVGYDVQDFTSYVNGHTVGSYWAKQWQGGDNALISSTPPPPVLSPQDGVYRSKNWGKPPRRGRSNGEHYYIMILISKRNTIITYVQDGTQYTGSPEGTFGPPVITHKWTPNDDLRLIGKLREKIIGSDFNPAITLGEGKRSLETILRAAGALAGAYGHAKRGNLKAAGKSLAQYRQGVGGNAKNALADNWLNFQYGIKPILNDVYNAAITLAHMTSVPLQQVITVRLKVPGVVSSSHPPEWNYNGWCYKSGQIKAILREVDTIKLIGLTDPATVAWELVPYSFVVDWFIPIGNFLEARGVANSLTGTFVTTHTEKSDVRGFFSTGELLTITSGGDEYRSRLVNVTRDVSTSINVPLPTVKPLRDWPSWSRAATSVALLSKTKIPKSWGEHTE